MLNTQPLKIARDITGVPMGAISFPQGNSFRAFLTGGVQQSVSVPPGYNIAIFAYSPQGVFVSRGTNPVTLPVGAFAQDDSDLNPPSRIVNLAGDQINMICSVNAYVQVRFETNQTGGA